MDDETIGNIVRRMETDYRSGNTFISTHVSFSLKDTIDRIEAYIFSKHISGDTDSLGREKPFFNIVTAARNIWYRATDLDRKNIRIKDKNPIKALLATAHLQNWMNRSKFGSFLNDWGRALATYGSAVVKFVERDGELVASVIPWNRLICDPIDFSKNPKIEKLFLTPSELRNNPMYDQEQVKKLLDARQSREDLGGQKRDNKPDYIPVYEIHIEGTVAQLNKGKGKEYTKADEEKYVQQMHVISFVESKEAGKYDDFTLYCGREDDPYRITHLIREDGRVMGIGAVEHLFDAQWMVNHSYKLIKDQLDLASKLVFQTFDKSFTGRNVLTSIENGDILIPEMNMPLTKVDNSQHDTESLRVFAQQWQVLGQGITNTPESQRGDTPPSGTAWHTVELVNQQSQSLFELMTENKGLHIEEDMLRPFIIPFIKSKLDTRKEILATLDDLTIRQIDSLYIKARAVQNYNSSTAEAILSGQEPQPFDQTQGEKAVAESLAPLGNKRLIAPDKGNWSDYFKDFEWECECEITNENKDKQTVLTDLNNAFKTLVSLAGRPMTPQEQLVFNKILDASGTVSPVELAQLPSAPVQSSAPGGGLPIK